MNTKHHSTPIENKKWQIWIVIAAILIATTIISIFIIHNNNNENTFNQTDSPTFGDPLHSGNFVATIHNINAPVKQLDNYENTTAQGEFQIINVSVTNTSNQTQTLTVNSFKLVSDGKEYQTDTGGELPINDDNLSFGEFEPGETKIGRIVFDVPTKTVIDSITFVDNFNGEPVTMVVQN